jgi:hypothetical protein
MLDFELHGITAQNTTIFIATSAEYPEYHNLHRHFRYAHRKSILPSRRKKNGTLNLKTGEEHEWILKITLCTMKRVSLYSMLKFRI